MISLSILTIVFVSLLVGVPAVAALTPAVVIAGLLSPFAAMLAVHVWIGTHIVSFVQSLFG
ncbi:MAG: hypothetical protein JWR35_3711 [Marmoricola sp.]|nr:hypothetical protein [Marmoricola sp.]